MSGSAKCGFLHEKHLAPILMNAVSTQLNGIVLVELKDCSLWELVD